MSDGNGILIPGTKNLVRKLTGNHKLAYLVLLWEISTGTEGNLGECCSEFSSYFSGLRSNLLLKLPGLLNTGIERERENMPIAELMVIFSDATKYFMTVYPEGPVSLCA